MQVYDGGWPAKEVDGARVDDNAALDNADAVLIFSDGEKGHPAFQGERAKVLDALAAQGRRPRLRALRGRCGRRACPAKPCSDGSAGYYERNFSVNPMWKPAFDKFPNHPVTRGVGPFATHDEWYFNMRWTADAAAKAKITPLLVATPSDEVRKGPYVSPRGPYDHIIAESGKAETMMWVFERPDGGRGLGFTGGHTHANWGDEPARIMLNALLWLAKVDVPAKGVEDTITDADLTQNLDDKRKP